MKYRCPHCKEMFESFDKAQCPTCGKNLRHPDKWRPPQGQTPGRRAPIQERVPHSSAIRLPVWMIFMNRPRFLVWVLGGCILAVGFTMTYDYKPPKPYAPPSRIEQTRKELMVIRTALEWFRTHCKRYPTTGEGLKALVRNPGVEGWQGFYIETLPPDIWGRPFQYSATNDTIRLFCLGLDGQAGTQDDIESPPPDYKALKKRLAKDAPARKRQTPVR